MLASLPAFLFPLYNPDLFWHLSAARWMAEHGALPRTDFLSFTKAGRPWSDFEWLSQLIFGFAYRFGGFGGLWLLKVALLAACAGVVAEAFRFYKTPLEARAAVFALAFLGFLGYSDIRPELFSYLFFACVAYLLERRRLGKVRDERRALLIGIVLFALWSDLHAAFPLGLAWIFLYAIVLRDRPLVFAGALCALATLANPYGAGPWRVIWLHWRERSALSSYIQEWRVIDMGNPVHWPVAALLAAVVLSAWRRRRGREAWLPLGAALGLGLAGLTHGRLAPFFALAAAFALAESFPLPPKAVLVVCAAFSAWIAPRISWARAFNDKFVPTRAAEFLAGQRETVAPLRVYNPWEWGGYLGWRLRPWYRVFHDGRYLFHSQLPEVYESFAQTDRWEPFLERNGLDAALMQNLPILLPTQKLYPDGSRRTFPRPFYLYYFPRERWALVYWDDQALLFVRRGKVPKAWLEVHEYRFVRPRDDAAFAEALRDGELRKDLVDIERMRHERELSTNMPRGM